MKYINLKTLTLMLSAFAVMVFTGCEGKVGDPSDSQLVGSVTPPGSGNTAPVANAGDAQLVIMERSDYYEPASAYKEQTIKEASSLPEEKSTEPKKEESAIDTSMDSKMAVRVRPEYGEQEDQNITVTLDGSGSFDADGDDLTYEWTLVSKPGRSEMAFDGSTEKTVEFDADIMGYYTFDLVVNDGEVDSEPSRVTISVKAYRIELVQRKDNDVSTTSTEMGISSTSNDNRSFTYNEYGQVLTDHYENNNGYSNDSTYTYDADGNTLTYHYENSDGYINDSTYTYDADGNTLTYHYENSDGNSGDHTYTYDADGNTLTVHYENSNGDSRDSTYTYDADGNTLTDHYVDNNGYSSDSTYTYDADGNMLTDHYEDSNGYSGDSTYTYDANGNMLTYHYENSDEYINDSTYTYDANGNMLTYHYENSNGYHGDYTYTYDTDGNMLTYNYTSNNNYSNNYTYTYTYDADGNMLTEYYEDSDEHERMHTYTYDEHGNMLTGSYDHDNDGIAEEIITYTWILLP